MCRLALQSKLDTPRMTPPGTANSPDYPLEPKDRIFPTARRNALLCSLATAVCILLVYPFADAPFGDDFSYTRTALDFARTGHFIYNGWATAMLGWQIPWGAAFIKLFGFSFDVVRLSTLPVAAFSVYLFHQILVRFGVGARDAILGCLTLGLSPLSFILSTTYMSDVPGVFAILLCLYMCQRAVVARLDRTAVLWLVFAGLLNIIGGTVRQTSWLGVLVMVPSATWLLRQRRGMLLAGVATTAAGALGVLSCIRWANHQPFFVPESIYVARRLIHPLSLPGDFAKVFLCVLLLVFPITAGCLLFVARLKPAAFLRIGALLCAVPAYASIHGGHGALDHWRVPWLMPILPIWTSSLPARISTPVSVALTVLVPAAALIFFELVLASRRRPATPPAIASTSWRAALWLVGPFALAYLCLLVPRAFTSIIQDRYLLGIVPSAIILLLLLHRRTIAVSLPTISVAVLCLFAIYTIAVTHDVYARLRARHAAAQELIADGMPRTSFTEEFAPDLWEQLEVSGYINSWDMVSASGHYIANVPPWPFPERCADSAPFFLEPAIRPEYVIGSVPDQCSTPTRYAAVSYSAWLPPFHRTVQIGRIVITNPEKAH